MEEDRHSDRNTEELIKLGQFTGRLLEIFLRSLKVTRWGRSVRTVLWASVFCGLATRQADE